MDIEITEVFTKDHKGQTVPLGWAVVTDGEVRSNPDNHGFPNIFTTPEEAQTRMLDIKVKRLQEINTRLEEIRATWTEEQKIDMSFHDPEFDRLCHEEFMILSGGKDTITLSADWVRENADEVVTL